MNTLLLWLLGSSVLTAGPETATGHRPILEAIEWTDAWVTHANEDERPRVLLVGDSIVKGYYRIVERELEGTAYCARLATSAFLTNPDYLATLEILLKRYRFAVIHINNGLHGSAYSEAEYAAGFPKLYALLKRCAPDAKIIWATTTPVSHRDNVSKINEQSTQKVRERNRIAVQFAKKYGIAIDDLFALVIDHPEYHRSDGVHFNGKGNEVLGKQVAGAIQEAIDQPVAQDGRYVEPTLRDVRYGPHERNVLNFWKAASDRPTPVVVLIHGGGWTTGAKAERFDRQNIDVWSGIPYLEAGISVVSIDYRLTPEHPLPAPLHDAARAVQFVRHKAAEWHLDKTRLAVAGGSAGGATSLWLAYHDDLADPDSDDPVARESTKPTCAVVEAPQTCIDPILCRQWVGEKILQHRMIPMSVGLKNANELLEAYDKFKETFHEFSAYFHVDPADPPVLLYGYGTTQCPAPSAGAAIHSPILCWKLKQKADEVGAECDFVLRSTRRKQFYNKTLAEFVKSKLLGY